MIKKNNKKRARTRGTWRRTIRTTRMKNDEDDEEQLVNNLRNINRVLPCNHCNYSDSSPMIHNSILDLFWAFLLSSCSCLRKKLWWHESIINVQWYRTQGAISSGIINETLDPLGCTSSEQNISELHTDKTLPFHSFSSQQCVCLRDTFFSLSHTLSVGFVLCQTSDCMNNHTSSVKNDTAL